MYAANLLLLQESVCILELLAVVVVRHVECDDTALPNNVRSLLGEILGQLLLHIKAGTSNAAEGLSTLVSDHGALLVIPQSPQQLLHGVGRGHLAEDEGDLMTEQSTGVCQTRGESFDGLLVPFISESKHCLVSTTQTVRMSVQHSADCYLSKRDCSVSIRADLRFSTLFS